MNDEKYILPEDIKNLLSRYYDGLTSLEEEKLLKKYFTEHQITRSLLPDQAILSLTNSDEPTLIPANEIWDKIKRNEIKKSRSKKIIAIASSAAASLLIVVTMSTWFYLSSEKSNNLATDTFTNPEEAYRVVQKYLGLASTKLSYAYTEMKPIEKLAIPSEALHSFSAIDRNLQRLNQLDRIGNTAQRIERFSIITDLMDID